MVLSIRTNLSAIGSLNQLREGANATRSSFAKLSSGSRISSSKDDASGLAISNNLRLSLASARSALTNITQASAVIQIADAGLQSIQGKINRMNEIATIAASSTLTDSERAHLDVEFQSLKEGITADTRSTTFNGENLLGQRPDFALGPVGSDIDADNGIVGFQFENDGLFDVGDIIEVTYDATTGVFQLENVMTSYRETLNAPTNVPVGQTHKLNFVQLGISLTLSSEFDFATDITPGLNDANFVIRANDPNAPTFLASDLAGGVLNLSVEDGAVGIVGTGVASVSDLEASGGNNQATQGAAFARPTIDLGGVFGRDALNFDGVDDVLGIADSTSINLGAQARRTIALNFETGANVTTTQVLFEEGGNVHGLNAYVQGGQLYFGVYRNSGAQTAFISTAIAANTQYTASFDFDSTTNTVRGYLNGVEFASSLAIGAALPSHTGDIGLGGVRQQTRIHTNTTIASGANFSGKIGDFLLYNNSFTAGDHANLNLFLRGASGASTAGFSNEVLAFQIDHTNEGQLEFKKPQADFLLSQISGLSVTNVGSANNSLNELRSVTDFLATERSKIGSILSQFEFAANQVEIFQENTTNANSVIRDTDIANETTELASRILRDRVNVLSLREAVDSGGRLLALLDSGR